MRKQRGITLIALVVTIIVLLILAGVTIATLTGDNGLLTKSGQARNTSEKGEIEEQIKLAYNEWKIQKETGETIGLKTVVENRLKQEYGNNATVSIQGKAISINVKSHEFTLIDNGTIEDGQLAYLDIADGSIQLYKDGYIQGTNAKVQYGGNGGRYLITGTTVQNTIRVMNEGEYDITIKNLNINFSDSATSQCPFSANAGQKSTGCFVKLKLEGNNYFQGKGRAGLAAGGGTPNVGDVSNGSSLTIDGKGSLETRGDGSTYGQPGIGGETNPSGFVSNIVIKSGNITAIGTGNTAGIGGGLSQNVNNIVIDGGNLTAKGGNGSGIGSRNRNSR